jgi:c-di-GMP-binding flagellar brake protein YcgR
MGDDRRRWARIEASLECNLATVDQTFEAKVVNVSRGGMAVMAGPGLAKLGDPVTVLLEREGLSLGLSGTVVRIFGAGDETMYGVHFEALPPDSEQQLLELLRALAAGRGSGRREHPRVAARIAVTCKSAERFTALLSDLSRGGMAIRCPRAVTAGATLAVEFGVGANAELFTIDGTVTHVEVLPDGKTIAGLSFTPPTAETRERAQQLLEVLLGIAAQS